MLKKMVTIVVVAIFTILIIIGVCAFLIFMPHKMSIDAVDVSQVSLKRDTAFIEGSVITSALFYSGYSYFTRDGNLYVTIRYGLMRSNYYGGRFSLTIQDEKLYNVQNVYLTDGKKEKKIYP